MTAMAAPHHVHATAVALDGRAIMFTGPPCAGKSELAMAMVEQGAQLIADDVVHLYAQGGQIMAACLPGRPGQIALRDIGLVDVRQAERPSPLALVIELLPAADTHQLTRFGPRTLGQYGPVDGLHCPKLMIDPRSPIILMKVRLALERWGH